MTKGQNTSFPNGPDALQVEFTVRGAGRDCGSALSLVASASEKITNKVQLIYPGPQHVQYTDDANFSSGAGAFYLSGNKIIDMKTTTFNANDWAAIPVGAVFFTFTQTSRITFQDCCNQAVPPLDVSFNLLRRKVSTTKWQLEVAP